MVTTPEWLKVGIRVNMNNNWPRFNLPKGAQGTVIDIDVSPVTKNLRWVTVVWDGLDNFKEGLHHFGWHATQGHITPV